MKAVGIIAEYNPLHNGHLYHLEESKKLAGTDAVVVAMSGNFCQRGEPAILDKWERSRLAVSNGADVVIEIPTLFCLGNSMQYGKAGVKLLDSLGVVSHLSFGSESGDIESLNLVANNLKVSKNEIETIISYLAKNEGLSYPRARELAYEKLFGSENVNILSNSNDNLALSYLQENSSMKPIAVKRCGAGYDDDIVDSYEFQSASGIRTAIIKETEFKKYVPGNVYESLENHIKTCPDEWLNCLKYAVLTMDEAEIEHCPSAGDGLGNKIKSEIGKAKTWDELIKSVKSKRYTYSRISRLCIQIILGINRNSFKFESPNYVRILALSKKGRELVAYSEKNELNELPVITNINKQKGWLDEDGLKLLKLDVHASDVYNLVTGRNHESCSDYRTTPFIQE